MASAKVLFDLVEERHSAKKEAAPLIEQLEPIQIRIESINTSLKKILQRMPFDDLWGFCKIVCEGTDVLDNYVVGLLTNEFYVSYRAPSLAAFILEQGKEKFLEMAADKNGVIQLICTPLTYDVCHELVEKGGYTWDELEELMLYYPPPM